MRERNKILRVFPLRDQTQVLTRWFLLAVAAVAKFLVLTIALTQPVKTEGLAEGVDQEQRHFVLMQQALVQRVKEIMAEPGFLIHLIQKLVPAAAAVQVPQDKTEPIPHRRETAERELLG